MSLRLICPVFAIALLGCGTESSVPTASPPAELGELVVPAIPVRATEAGAEARVPSLRGSLRVTDGASIAVDGSSLRVSLAGWGRDALVAPTLGDAEVQGTRILRHSPELDAWWDVGPAGARQGWTLHTAPDGDGPVRLRVLLDGLPLLGVAGDTARFARPDGGLLRYGGVAAWDADGRALDASIRFAPEGDGLAAVLTVEDAGATWPITVDPIVTTALWEVQGSTASGAFGYAVSTGGDVNGDGYSDVVVGIPGVAGTGKTGIGEVRLYLGSAAGPALTPTVAWNSSNANQGAGSSVAFVGDLNGDGYADFAAGGPGTSSVRGQVYVWFGGSLLGNNPQVTIDAPNTTLSSGVDDLFGTSLDGVGDLDGDGYGDLLVGAPGADSSGVITNAGATYLYEGNAFGLQTTASWSASGTAASSALGTDVAGLGDVNGDGFPDFAASQPGNNTGTVRVYFGASAGPTGPTTISGSQGSLFGTSVAGPGDLDGDGYADLVIGAPNATCSSGSQCGGFAVHLGSSSGIGTTPFFALNGTQAGARLGLTVAEAGDLDGDGLADFAVAEPYWDGTAGTDHGRVHLWFGDDVLASSAELSTGAAPPTTLEGTQAGERFGFGLGAAGDSDGDGFGELIVGSPSYDDGNQTDVGRAQVFSGEGGDPNSTAVWDTESNQAGAELGASVASAGDVNGDGWDDVVVGLPGYMQGSANRGRFYLFLGTPSGVAVAASSTYTGSGGANGRLGASVAGIGDVNGDGYEDVAAGEPFNGTGLVKVFYGSSGGLPNNPDLTLSALTNGSEFGASVAGAGDVNGDGFADVIVGAPGYSDGQADEGAALVYLGSASGLSSGPAWWYVSNQSGALAGASVSSAGDLNGDGYDDVAIGVPAFDGGGITDTGAVFVAYGSPSGLGSASGVFRNIVDGLLGTAVARIGDFNGDGYGDLAASAPDLTADRGRLYVAFGAAGGIGNVFNDWVTGDVNGTLLGTSIAGPGDVDGDGYADIVAGGPGAPGGGEAYVLYGNAAGTLSLDWTWGGTQSGAQIGAAVGGGDFNGDGFGDLLVGVPSWDAGQTDEGGAFALLGNTSDGASFGLGPAPLVRATAAGVDVVASLTRLPDPTEMELDLLLRPPSGRASVGMEVEVESLGTPFDGAGTQTSAFVDSGVVGVSQLFTVTGLTASDDLRWRARYVTDPLDASAIPHGPWLLGGRPGDTSGVHVRTACLSDGDGDGLCDEVDLDVDGDGSPGTVDCDDLDPTVYPGAPETPDDGIDQDCDGADATLCFADNDVDGFGTGGQNVLEADGLCGADSSTASAGGDCNDTNPAVNPGATEICNGIDDDCDGLSDDADPSVSGQPTWYPDGDQDGWGDGGAPVLQCSQPSGAVAIAGDCDDGDATVYPGAAEVCDGVDTNCDGTVPLSEQDVDADGFASCDGDCNDNAGTVYPGAPEICDGVDSNCDGVIPAPEADADGDGVLVCAGDCNDASASTYPGAPELCDGADNDCDGSPDPDEIDGDGDGSRICAGDCDDSDGGTYPGAPEVCDGIDNDCDGTTADEGSDADADGETTCTDCDDADAFVYTGAPEFCDGKDTNCDGVLPPDESDADGDQFVVCNLTGNPPAGLGSGDCDDTAPAIYPGAPELCDGLDGDCDGVVPSDELDGDGDGIRGCSGDCDDSDPTVYPGAAELCDGLDNDCNGSLPAVEADADGDGVATCDGDCADGNPNRFPGNTEACDGVDNDCDGLVPANETDDDGDGSSECGGDCDDGDGTVFTGAPELCDRQDNDCDGVVPIIETDDDGDGQTECEGDCDDADPVALSGAPEACDGIDGDCDGAVDEDFDGDADGFFAGLGCSSVWSPLDCDDADATVNPDATDVCNGVDDDCDGVTDAGFDGDGDGYFDASACPGGDDCDDSEPTVFPGSPEVCDGLDNDCNGTEDDGFDGDGDGFFDGSDPDCLGSYSATDCDDTNPAIFPGAAEVCDGLDDDCSGSVPAVETDADGDGYVECANPTHLPGLGGDCDDTNSTVSPAGTETCDTVDNDCDGSVDEDFDADGDGYFGGPGCEAAWGASADCDDTLVTVFPGAVESCNEVDEDCDGLVDEDFDADGDGVTSCGGDCDDSDPTISPNALEDCTNGIDDDCDGSVDVDVDADADGVSTCSGDCDDDDAAVFPGQTESCDGVDEDCDGAVDEGFDADGDGATTCGGDCDDGDPLLFPGQTEICDGVDQDCDGDTDELFDLDGDGYATCAGDCDDSNSTINPGESESCDGLDNDCSGAADEPFDLDGDGAFDGSVSGCASFYGASADCDDTDATVFGGAPELCDGLDNDCEGSIPGDELDADGDAWVGCDPPVNHVGSPLGGGDCDDGDPAVNPGAAEVCNGIDDDCSGAADEPWDLDADGYADGSVLVCQGTAFLGPTDCDDTDAAVFPGAPELCNTVDDNCDGQVDEDSDLDGDGWYDALDEACVAAWGALGVDLDCDDMDVDVFPFQIEDCTNGIDDNCDGQIDEDTDDDGDGVTTCAGDCDDDDPTILPGALELCDGRDNDCDLDVDEDFDLDGDGVFAGVGCLAFWGEVDCDDADAGVFPGALEACDGTDEDCDWAIDEIFDLDQDGYFQVTAACGATYGLSGLDCDDGDASVSPGEAEVCDDGFDNDCDGAVDGDDVDCPGGDDDDSTGDDDDSTGDDDDSTGDDDDSTGDDDDSTGDDDDSADLEPFYFPGCRCDSDGGDAGSGWMLLLVVGLGLGLRRRREGSGALLLLLVGLSLATPAFGQESGRKVLVLTPEPDERQEALAELVPEGFGATLRTVMGEQNVGGVWLLGIEPDRICAQTSVPGSQVSGALGRARDLIDELAVEDAESLLTDVRLTLACMEEVLDPSELWRLYFLEGVAAFYRLGLPAARPSMARALAVLPGQYYDDTYPPDLGELYREIQKGALEGDRASVVAGTDGGPEIGAVFVNGFPVAGPGLALAPGEHVLQVRLASGALAGAVVRLSEDDVVAVGLPDDVPEAARRLERPQQMMLAEWIRKWALVAVERVWLDDGAGGVVRLGETDADRVEIARPEPVIERRGMQLTSAQRDPVLLVHAGGGYQLVGRGNYGGAAADLSVRLKGPLRLALGARAMVSQPVIHPVTEENLGVMFLVPVQLGVQLRFSTPFVQVFGLGAQVGPNPGGSEGGVVLPGVIGQVGAEFPLGASRLLVRPLLEVGNLGKYFTLRALVSVGLAIGPNG